MSRQIYLDAPNIGEEEKRYLAKAIDTGHISTFGPFVSEFESKFSDYLGIQTAVSLQSGTAGLHMALYELGINKSDEVIVPNLTFIATVNPVVYVGAKPVFVDVDLETWNISAGEIEKKVTKNTKAIIPVHFYGNPCNMDEIMSIAEKHRLSVIEDAAESLGAKYKGRFTGTIGDFGVFSFNGNKVITTAGGGMLSSKDTKYTDHIRFLVNQARDEKLGWIHSELGFNLRMTNLEASLGLAQMERLEEFLAKKRAFNRIYKEELKEVKGISFQEESSGSESSFWFSCLLFKKDVCIPTLQKELKAKGIPTRRVFPPITESGPYKKYKQPDLKNSYYIYERGLCLPSSTLNSEDNIIYVCKVLKMLLG